MTAAWSDYWASGQARSNPGCVPNRLSGIDAAQASVWSDLARRLRRQARVLDIATGDGAVLASLRAARSDLKLIGVDSSAVLPPAPKGIALKPGVAMEKLPFAPASFDAVTSQFGFEYGDTGQGAVEIARVLRPAGLVAMIVHDATGPIVSHNIGRRKALTWALDALLGKARALVASRRIAPIPTPAHFADAVAEGRRRFADQGAAAELAQAILQTLELGRQAPPEQSLGVLQTLENRALNEIARIDALCAAARDRDGLEAILAQLRDAGIDVEAPGRIAVGDDPPFAWSVSGRKAI